MVAPGIPELGLKGRGGDEASAEIPPADEGEGATKAGKRAKVSRKKRRAGLGSSCASAIDDYQAATGKSTLNPVFGHLVGEFRKFAMDGSDTI